MRPEPSADQVWLAVAALAERRPYRDIARSLGLTYEQVRRIKRGEHECQRERPRPANSVWEWRP
jgi:predicted transcriptional regulator